MRITKPQSVSSFDLDPLSTRARFARLPHSFPTRHHSSSLFPRAFHRARIASSSPLRSIVHPRRTRSSFVVLRAIRLDARRSFSRPDAITSSHAHPHPRKRAHTRERTPNPPYLLEYPSSPDDITSRSTLPTFRARSPRRVRAIASARSIASVASPFANASSRVISSEDMSGNIARIASCVSLVLSFRRFIAIRRSIDRLGPRSRCDARRRALGGRSSGGRATRDRARRRGVVSWNTRKEFVRFSRVFGRFHASRRLSLSR